MASLVGAARSLSSSRLSLLILHRSRLSVSANPPIKTIPPRRLFCTEPPNMDVAILFGLLHMCKGLERDGHEKEALNLFYEFFSNPDKATVPAVLISTIQITVELHQRNPTQALSMYASFLESGGLPNAYTYAVLIKGLSMHGNTGAAKKFMVEMMGKRIKPNANALLFLMDGLVREGKVKEGKKLVHEMKLLGLMPGEKAIEEALGGLRGIPMIDILRDILSTK